MKDYDFRTDVLPLKDELYRLALRITLNRAEAEDVVQETLLKVWNRRESWGEIESMDAFCLKICRNQSLDVVRRRQGGIIDDNGEAASEPPDTSSAADPARLTESRDRLDLVRRIIDRLPEKQRVCMQMRDIEGHSYREIATTLDITEQQVKVNIFRARQFVRQQFTETEHYGL